MTGLFDAGANLTHASFAEDFLQVLQAAIQAGVSRISVTGTSANESKKALALALAHSEHLTTTAGVHPHNSATVSADDLQILEQLAADPLVRAIGETGLDYYRDLAPRRQQQQAFQSQLDLAVRLHMPVFMHQRDAHRDFTAILREHRAGLTRAVVHCFTGTAEELDEYLNMDLYIGITGWICDERRGQHLRELVPRIPPERLLIETDAPYLLPRTLRPRPRSRRNEPRFLVQVAERIAKCCNKAPDRVNAETNAAAQQFFAG